MKLRNKKTGEISDFQGITMFKHPSGNWAGSYKKLSELNDEWEDYEEPKKYYYYIESACKGGIDKAQIFNCEHCEKIDDFNKSIGNYFETKEEAEKAVEKLKAWKRLKDKGMKFRGYYMPMSVKDIEVQISFDNTEYVEIMEDLDILFGD